jgi:hypothetical protein
VQYRTEDIKAMLNVRWYFEGSWSGSSQGNRLDMYVNQFRGGGLLRTYLVAISNNADSCFLSGERTFMGFAAYGEDINFSTDDFQVEIANQTSGGNDITVSLAQVELKFILAQRAEVQRKLAERRRVAEAAAAEQREAQAAAEERAAAERASAETVAAEEAAAEEAARSVSAPTAVIHRGRGGRGGRGGRAGRRGVGTMVASSAEPSDPTPPPPPTAISLACASLDLRRPEVTESSVGGQATCIVCFTNPKSHLAFPCGHQCSCGPCSERMTTCPYCRQPVIGWTQARVV